MLPNHEYRTCHVSSGVDSNRGAENDPAASPQDGRPQEPHHQRGRLQPLL